MIPANTPHSNTLRRKTLQSPCNQNDLFPEKHDFRPFREQTVCQKSPPSFCTVEIRRYLAVICVNVKNLVHNVLYFLTFFNNINLCYIVLKFIKIIKILSFSCLLLFLVLRCKDTKSFWNDNGVVRKKQKKRTCCRQIRSGCQGSDKNE